MHYCLMTVKSDTLRNLKENKSQIFEIAVLCMYVCIKHDKHFLEIFDSLAHDLYKNVIFTYEFFHFMNLG